jgi:alkanesulfonate monooxygenase SsuD/methylene tetrahydromethanopterin reductase-like flavin-dependent oxidoreductase (luciferase family)
MSTPEIGVFLPTMSRPGERPGNPAAAARHAERLGLGSVWAVDQLVAGTGVPLVDATVALAAAAGATSRIRLGYGVMILPLRPVVWAAKEAASLQYASGGRLLLGVGVGGDRHDASWAAAGADRRRRGRSTDEALAVLPELIAGRTVRLGDADVVLSPGVEVPPIVVGGTADASLRRAARHGGWFAMPVPPRQLAPVVARLAAAAEELGRPAPAITAGAVVALDGDPAVGSREAVLDALADPDGVYGMPRDVAAALLVEGGPPALAERIGVLAEMGAERVVVTLAAGDWFRQAELLAEAASLTTAVGR